jgi:chromosome segregation protein
MRLSKIKLSGFKSFVDPTTIHFPSNLMGIVGPNGCGKSNIIDAIRWVLGEGSAKTLRGDSMADVIFNGSSGRKPVGQASIELIFDNSDGTLSGPYASYAEVAIRRVVSRDGTSQYFLNNSRCRRKDITHILLGTGLGSHGYSIIEQGMISRLVEAKPEELRAFLEEAAGISKYKERRRETEHRIRHTRENLDRLADLREEVDKQLAHLRRQARAAERYKSLKAEQRRIEAELLALRLLALQQEVRRQESARNEKQTALEAAIAEQRSLESTIEKLRITLTERNDDFNQVQGRYYRVGAEIARLEQSIQHRKELSRRQQEDLEATDEHLTELKSHIESDQVELEEIERLLGELSPGLQEARLSQQASVDALRQAEEAMEDWRGRWDRVAGDVAESERAREVENARLEQLGAQRERLVREREKLLGERSKLTTEELEQRLHKLIANEETLSNACGEATRALESVWEQIRKLRQQDSKVSTHLDQMRGQLQNDRGRLASLEALQVAALGESSEQISGWLRSQELDSSPRLAERLSVEPGWERAVETVLGAYLQAICVESIEQVAQSLTELSGGGLTLLDTAAAPRPADHRDGDMLRDHVRGQGVERLLADVHAAESLPAAVISRKRLRAHESVVTRDGFWLGPDWLRINRSDDPQVGVLARGDEIKRLSNEVAAGSRRVAEIEKALLDTRSRLEQLEDTRARAQAEANKRQHLYAETKGNLETSRDRLQALRSQAGALERGVIDLDAETRAIADDIEACEARLSAAAARRDELGDAREQLERVREHHQLRLAEARARAEEDRQLAQDIAIKVESRRSSRESASAAIERVRVQQEHLLKRRRELVAQLESSTEPLQGEEQALQSQLDERLRVEQNLAQARKAMEGVDAELREVSQLRTNQEQHVSAAREALEGIRLVVREIQVRADTVSEQFAKTEFDLGTLTSELPDDATSEQWAESFEKIENRIQRLGAINLAAIDEYREQSERKEYLDSQFADLTEALETLENAIRKIDRETRARFKETFDEANAGMGRLFPRLFGGGHAYLELDGDDLLSSGVTVMARPPGKRISTIHLLSGGEKALAAVALVFSIFELNPAPFCLLDEVDAPLDDANVGRFSEIVKEMSQQVQFVLITHNKATMEVLGQLTGVTMNEPGVSRLVAVDIDEAVQLAAM